MDCRSLGCWKSAYSVFLSRLWYDNKSWICNQYNYIVHVSGDCRCSNSWDTKSYTFLYFPILSGDNAFNSVRMGIRGWADWSNTWANHWRYITCLQFNFTAGLHDICL